MAVYKVPQDIEAEDKLLGPLTLKQFIYAGIAALCLYISFIAVSKHASFLLIIFMPVALLAGFLAFPWSREQPTEIWALAKIRFLLKPRRRLWDQSGVKELVTITAPKKIEHTYTNGLSQTEVKSRLRALADTIDSRGWAIKNVNVNLYGQPAAILEESDSDRLIDVANLPQEVPTVDVNPGDDIFEGAVAHHFGQMITATDQAHREQIMQQLYQASTATMPAAAQAAPNDYWFLNQSTGQQQAELPRGYATFNNMPVVHPGMTEAELPVAEPTPSEKDLSKKIETQSHQPAQGYSHLKTIQPLPHNGVSPTIGNTKAGTSAPAVTPSPKAGILNLAKDNDKDVATLARMSHATDKRQQPEPPDEIVVSLH